jgi:hypothetical protein
MSRPKSKPIYSRYLKPALRPTAEFFEHITNKCPEYIPAALRIIDSEGFMMVEPRVLLGPKGLNSIRPKVSIGSIRFDIGRRAEHYMSPKAVYQPNCWYTVERDI